jgi:hypothetical protein
VFSCFRDRLAPSPQPRLLAGRTIVNAVLPGTLST